VCACVGGLVCMCVCVSVLHQRMSNLAGATCATELKQVITLTKPLS
jgi:hypothetical protein